MLETQAKQLDKVLALAAEHSSDARLLMAQPGIGPVTALAFVLTIGDVKRFPHSRQVSRYLGLIPRERSSGGKQKMGSITKQGNRLLRFLLVEAATTAVRYDPNFRKAYLHRCHIKHRAVARVSAARNLALLRHIPLYLVHLDLIKRKAASKLEDSLPPPPTTIAPNSSASNDVHAIALAIRYPTG